MGSLRLILCGLILLGAGTVRAQSAEEEAGDISEVDKDRMGPLRERIRPVSGHVFLKKKRFELSPSISASIKDAFFTKLVAGGSLTYHLSDSFAIGARAGYGFDFISSSAQICTSGATGTIVDCRSPRYDEVNGRAPGQLKLIAGLDAQWSPIYGKLAIVAERFLHFDVYGILGPSAVQYLGPSTSGANSDPRFTIGGNVGVGARIFLDRWMTIRAELRDLVYVENVQPLPAKSLRNQMLFELGFSMFFPTLFEGR